MLCAQMCRQYPGSHLTGLKNTIDQLIDKAALSFCQFGHYQVGYGSVVTAERIFHDPPVSATFVFDIVGCFNNFPFITQTFLSLFDVIIPIISQKLLPGSAIGIIRIRNPLPVHQ